MKYTKRNLFISILTIVLLYFSGYIIFRQTNMEIWEEDENAYVIFPENKILYYVYRPVSLIDGKITGMRFHIGRHQ
ncbi:MAG: hypothetical protein ACR2MD_09240 [Aridibacter sp.]|jgi:hypothetical protein|nr:hypothetical protein [Acidobacteriota bacterium]